MSSSPATILAKLDELKKWQEKQQERLMEQHQKRLHCNSVENISAEQLSEKSWSPPKGNYKFAKEMVANVVEDDETRNEAKPKKPFLRRGTGLVRFRMTPGQQFKPFTKTNQSSIRKSLKKVPTRSVLSTNEPLITTENVTKDTLSEGAVGSDAKHVTNSLNKPLTPLKKPHLSIRPKAVWCNTTDAQNGLITQDVDSLSSQIVDLRSTQDMIDNNISKEAIKLRSEKSYVNSSDHDLLIFEALEQRAMQSSFCSTNSSIIQLLSSTPNKTSPLKAKHFSAATVYVQKKSANNNVIQQRPYQNSGQRGPVIEEIVEDECSPTPRPDSQALCSINEFERKLQGEYLSLIEKVLQFKQCAAGTKTCCSSASSVASEDIETTDESTLDAPTNFNDKNKWTEGDMCTTEDSSFSSSSSRVWEGSESRCNAATMTESVAEHESDALLQTKLREMEAELKAMHLETVRTNKLKAQLEQQQKEFEKHKKEIVQQVEDEKIRINQAMEDDKKKLAKDKMVFERYIKDLQNKPSRKEREEIAALKAEVATFKETLKLKETKNGMTQARLRNQIKSLEKENAALKAEFENLNKQNARLVASQKLNQKPSDTKILHQINKNLTKLAQERDGKQRAQSKELLSEEDDDECLIEPINSNKSVNRFSAHFNKSNVPEVNKENSKNTLNSINPIEETYKHAFGIDSHEGHQRLSTGSMNENKKNDQTEQTLDDGTKQFNYSNGNVKLISPDGNHIILKYYNGDVKETNLLEGTVRYHYSDSKVNHTTNADGTELIEFPDGQIERRLAGGVCEVQYTNGVVRRTRNDGIEEISYPDGTTVTVNGEGERVLLLPNGQKEIHTKAHKRREYPDGTVKILYPDGHQETRYASGRVRLKDKNGKLLMDSQDPTVNA